MIDPEARITDKLLLREGLRFTQSIETISEATGISKKKLVAAAEGGKIGLPKYAEDNAEGFLFPATYELEKGESATEVLSRLVDRWERGGGRPRASRPAPKENGVTPYEAMIIASLIQAEGHPDDFDKVARVIYNRLDEATWGGTYGYLQMDATVNYALDKSEINLTDRGAAEHRLAVQHLQVPGPAADPDQLARRGGDGGGAEPGRRATGCTT